MVKEVDIAFGLVRSALDGTTPEVEQMDTSRWWSLFRLMQRNHVAALCFDAANAAGAPRDVLMPWLAEHEKAVGWYQHQEDVQREIINAMAQHGVETLVLKGTCTAQHYPQAELREFGDLDLYFYDKHDKADRVAQEVLKADVSNDAHHHSKYNYRGATVESHYDFVNVHYPPSNRRYEAILKQLAGTKEQLPTFEVLFQLRHLACHFAASRLTLRSLVDWALTCQALEGQVDWEMVQRTVKEYGMEAFAGALCTLAEHHLGRHLLLADDVDSKTISRMEHDMVYGTVADHAADGIGRLGWKMRRWRALGWKRRLVFNDSPALLLWASITSHGLKPQSILHKM